MRIGSGVATGVLIGGRAVSARRPRTPARPVPPPLRPGMPGGRDRGGCCWLGIRVTRPDGRIVEVHLDTTGRVLGIQAPGHDRAGDAR